MTGRFLPVLLALFFAPPALSHYLDIAQFSMQQQADQDRFKLTATLPPNLNAKLPVNWPQGCSMVSRNDSLAEQMQRIDFELACEPDSRGQIQTRWGKDGALLELQLNDGSRASSMLAGGPLGAALPLPDWQSVAANQPLGFWATAWRYLELGTVHVLVGWDHLAFVLCLSLLATGSSLLWLISAFTLGHSISLALAHLGVVNIPIAPVEAVIALSVVFMAREALLLLWRDKIPRGGEKQTISWRAGITAAFGLIHGLGFASVLGGLGVTAGDTVTALAFFNIGVEAGQILFVLVVLALIRLFRTYRVDLPLQRAAAAGVGGLGLIWTLERVIGF